MVKRVHNLVLQESDSTDQEGDTNEEQDNIAIPIKTSKGKSNLRSGRGQNANSSLKHKCIWPQKIVYNKGSPSDLSISQFIRGFTILACWAKPAITKYMT